MNDALGPVPEAGETVAMPVQLLLVAVSVPVDLSGVVRPGASFAVRNVQDLFGTPVVSGVYRGGAVGIPMIGVAPFLGTGELKLPGKFIFSRSLAG